MPAGLALFVESVEKIGYPAWRPKDDIVHGLRIREYGYRCYAAATHYDPKCSFYSRPHSFLS
ncbi:MAG: hypothetical protein GPOALKHO_001277 [Sodalis sp.]|nr:MAG: hypothetical protein GPOALKHO_001277 [Sodalis sp.]